MRTVLLVATVVGFVMTAGGIVLAYRGALQEVARSKARVARAFELWDDWHAESKLAKERGDDGNAVSAKYGALYEAEGITPPTWANGPFQGVMEAERIFSALVVGARANLIWAGVGLVISTAASAGSLFVD